MFEVDDETDVVISRKLKNKDAKCHIHMLGINEDDISHYVCKRIAADF